MKLGPLQTQWIAELRSGRYVQITGQLHDPVSDGYCCLGLACRVLGLKPTLHEDQGCRWAQFEDQQDILPESVREKMKFRGTGGERGDDPDRMNNTSLYQLNDHLVLSFEKIADVVEANPEAYFTEAA